MDAGVLFGSHAEIERAVVETARAARDAGVRHIMNLGHGVQQGTEEEAVRHWFEVAKTVHERW
jgi:uroporphyrinogen decarboxylase